MQGVFIYIIKYLLKVCFKTLQVHFTFVCGNCEEASLLTRLDAV